MTLKDKAIAIAVAHGISISEHDTLASVLREFGDELRSSRLRHELGQSDLPALCTQALKETGAEIHMEAMRAIANLCIDNSTLF